MLVVPGPPEPASGSTSSGSRHGFHPLLPPWPPSGGSVVDRLSGYWPTLWWGLGIAALDSVAFAAPLPLFALLRAI